jgi:GNAT superfamily N-acetyltransferase
LPATKIELRDGSHVAIRPVRPDDRDGLVAGFERVGPESRYRRFFTPKPELTARDLDYLTQIDHHDHEALVAVDLDTRDGVGVARYVRTGDGVAEPAVLVVDDWHGRGLGTALLRELAERAQVEGIRRFEAPILASNEEVMHVIDGLGDASFRRENGETILEMTLPAPGRVPRWAGLLTQFSTGALELERTLLARVRSTLAPDR